MLDRYNMPFNRRYDRHSIDVNFSKYNFFIFLLNRFWKQGYWRNHLQGRSYHISALYIVDLKRFRRIAAGDRLRGQYQALSQDPNSLSNLGK